MSNNARKLAVITGANQGIGLAIARAIAKEQNFYVLLGSRDIEKGKAAVEQLRDEGVAGINCIQLDVTDDESVKRAVQMIKQTFPEGVDVLVNNAGLGSATGMNISSSHSSNPDNQAAERARTIINTNYHGVKRVTNAFQPFLARRARVVNVASSLGQLALDEMSETLRNRFLADNITEKEIDELIGEYIEAVEQGNVKEKGWPVGDVNGVDWTAYGVSKAGVIAMTRCYARDSQDEICFNACCVSYAPFECVDTRMSHAT